MAQPAAHAREVLLPADVVVTAGHERELLEHLAARPRVVEALRLAVRRLRETFPGAKLVLGLYRDPEEDWAYPLLVLSSPFASDADRERADRITTGIAVEIMEAMDAGAEEWFDVTIAPVWPEARN